ncbi:MAG: hypothetical protein QM578_12535 [Pantoea sp.]|uniref:hypothetical protein n=1 Tax=Pantoea sp. TaxID=69393 RepID=UPI0039E5E8DA
MMIREEIIKYLKEQGHATSTQVHNHIETLGFLRCSSMGMLSKMVTAGIVIRHGYHQDHVCRLRTGYTDGKAARVPQANFQKPRKDSVNSVFEECRQLSAVQQFDRLIKQAREGYATT